MELSKREKAILCGLYLAKYDARGLQWMGLASFQEAFSLMGGAMDVPPATIKNYRDELDPLFPNARKGWRERPLRAHCKAVFDAFHAHSADALFSAVVRATGGVVRAHEGVFDAETFSKRTLTGRAAENFFIHNYHAQPVFEGGAVEDVTHSGCGYDFELRHADHTFAVEVKGLAAAAGSIALTEKEHAVAKKMTDHYFLYVVKNLADEPFAAAICNPLHAGLVFKKQTQKIVQTRWNASV